MGVTQQSPQPERQCWRNRRDAVLYRGVVRVVCVTAAARSRSYATTRHGVCLVNSGGCADVPSYEEDEIIEEGE
jgi:hypothetical protein